MPLGSFRVGRRRNVRLMAPFSPFIQLRGPRVLAYNVERSNPPWFMERHVLDETRWNVRRISAIVSSIRPVPNMYRVWLQSLNVHVPLDKDMIHLTMYSSSQCQSRIPPLSPPFRREPRRLRAWNLHSSLVHFNSSRYARAIRLIIAISGIFMTYQPINVHLSIGYLFTYHLRHVACPLEQEHTLILGMR